ncbi:MAG: histidine--tRNA ligase [Anaplasmataceae bacterium]|nr:histidine--tRNA ligase [Candidatus Heimdallarchaeota archaeon]MDH5796666.1 histidine--tRNA ligase [Anaplasmataceae bacterium]
MYSNISGFPEFLPENQVIFDEIKAKITKVFQSYGFLPMDTVAVEKVTDILKKGNDSEIYGIYRLKDKTNTDFALRFDLTVPLARYISQHRGRLLFPFRRYHIAPVWRGERAQAGRYRQFYQCDIDIISRDSSSTIIGEIEILQIIPDVFKILNIKDFKININNRKLLRGIIGSFFNKNIDEVIRIIDKLDKLSQEKIIELLSNLDFEKDKCIEFLQFITQDLEWKQWHELLTKYDNEEIKNGLEELNEVFEIASNLDEMQNQDRYKERFHFNILEHINYSPTLARGLDYYTGNIFEVSLPEEYKLGSVVGGGRYDNLVNDFCGEKLIGVGISFGLSRLVPRLIEMGILKTNQSKIGSCLMTIQDKKYLNEYLGLTRVLRKHGIPIEIYNNANDKLGTQLKYADKRGFNYVIIIGEKEFNNQEYNGQYKARLNNLITGDRGEYSLKEAINILYKSQNEARYIEYEQKDITELEEERSIMQKEEDMIGEIINKKKHEIYCDK